jgi:hypothetical protein
MERIEKVDNMEVTTGLNCYNCKFATIQEDGKVLCDKREFEDGQMRLIEADKASIDCPCHSEINGLTPTYETGHIFTSDEYCAICHRKLINPQMVVKDSGLHRNICVKCDSYKKIICNNCDTKKESNGSEGINNG